MNFSAHEFEIKPDGYLEETLLNFADFKSKYQTLLFVSLDGRFLTRLSRHISLVIVYNIILFILSVFYLNQK